ncbi:MAG: hypothetical protein KAT15_03830 [Bacteroidales bacterium]|nr:hypothetical protein [Bacteroidales bacterium]
MKRYNTIRLGVLLGLLAPVLAFAVIYIVAFQGMAFGEFIELLVFRKRLSSMISLSVIPNLFLFFIFIWLNYLYSARGVLASTLVLGLIVVITKFLI